MAQVGENEWIGPLHPALADHHELDFSIHRGLFDAIARDERFIEWQSNKNNWQLRLTGSPGCGKTTLSSIIVEELRNDGQVVACLFLQREVTSEGWFIEDFLHSLFAQFSRDILPSIEDEWIIEYQKYVEACKLQQRGSHRLILIRNTLHAVVPKLQQAFLIVDGIDRCSPATLMFAEEEISYLQRQGIKIMTTSRVPWVDEPFELAYCDGKACCTNGRPRLIKLYWSCEECRNHADKVAGITVFCKSCFAENPGCVTCDNHAHFSQPYKYVDFNISHMPGIDNLIRHAIEQEYGYIGASGSSLEEKLPASTFGKELLRSGKADEVIQEIESRAAGNIALALKRLEVLHRDQSLKVFFTTRDRLPAAIVDMFDASLDYVEAQTANERTLGLQAIAIVGRDENGVDFEEFKKLTQLSARIRGIDRKYDPCRSVDDVLHATKGLVVRGYHRRRENRRHWPLLKAFHPDFFLYCREHYHPSIVWANSLLRGPENGLSPLKHADTFGPVRGTDSSTISTLQIEGAANSPLRKPENDPNPLKHANTFN